MSLHDQYARLTPFEVAFPDRTVLAALSDRVAHETQGRGTDDTLPEVFMTTAAVSELVRAMRGPDTPPETTYPLASLIYQSVHFLRAGCPLYLLETAAVRKLTEGSPGGSTAEPPTNAGYLQLPQHLVWTGDGPSGAGAPESLDGVFWTLSGSGMLNALPIAGMLPDRPGFGALPLPAAPIADARAWLHVDARASGDDFASRLPGGELDELYAVEAAGEILKLLGRFFALVSAEPASREERAPGAAGGPRPSTLPYTRVSLGG
jgi:hypothetical protein